MQYDRKEKEVHFHLDRSKEASNTMVKSIVDNPQLSAAEQCSLLIKLARHHEQIVNLIGGSLSTGESMSATDLTCLED